jgi:hypothetical protein
MRKEIIYSLIAVFLILAVISAYLFSGGSEEKVFNITVKGSLNKVIEIHNIVLPLNSSDACEVWWQVVNGSLYDCTFKSDGGFWQIYGFHPCYPGAKNCGETCEGLINASSGNVYNFTCGGVIEF